MRLQLFHPRVAAVPCRLCQQFVYDWDQRNPTYGQRRQHGGQDWLRPDNVPPPCAKCPKGSPEQEHESMLSPKNLKTFLLFLRIRATAGRCLTPRQARDPVLLRNLSVVDSMVRCHERQEAAEALLPLLPLAGRA